MVPRDHDTPRPIRLSLAVGVLLAQWMIVPPVSAWAQNTRLPPVIESMTAPVSETEMAGIGCLVGAMAAGGAVVALAGGLGPVTAALQGPLTPLHVLEGGAALAFLLSSACYVGQALTPTTVLGWNSMTTALTPATAKAQTSVDDSDGSNYRFQKARSSASGRPASLFLLTAPTR